MSVHDYMDAANRAYYAAGTAIGAAGDFITAPEISQMFGELIGLWLADIWTRAGGPAEAAYAELGPGRGTLAADALRVAARYGWVPPVHLVETSPGLRAHQRRALALAQFHDDITTLPPVPLLIVANEFFDALPIRQAVRTHSGWRERVVLRGELGRFAAMAGTREIVPPLPERLITAGSGSVFEWAPAARTLMMRLARHLAVHGGAMLIIDYGHDAPQLGDTLQAVQGHGRADPFAEPGTRDLTAHVDFSALATSAASATSATSVAGAAAAAGAMIYGPVGQGEWLCRLGIDVRLEALAHANPARGQALRVDRNRLVEEGQMGKLFRVMAVTGSDWPAPEGFA